MLAESGSTALPTEDRALAMLAEAPPTTLSTIALDFAVHAELRTTTGTAPHLHEAMPTDWMHHHGDWREKGD